MMTVTALAMAAFFLVLGRQARKPSKDKLRRPLPRAVLTKGKR